MMDENDPLIKELLILVEKNFRCGNEIFQRSNLPYTTEYDDDEYGIVQSDEFKCADDLRSYLSEIYTDHVLIYLMEYYCSGEPMYFDVDGRLAIRFPWLYWMPVSNAVRTLDVYGIENVEANGDKCTFTVYLSYNYLSERGNFDADETRVKMTATYENNKWKLDSIDDMYLTNTLTR